MRSDYPKYCKTCGVFIEENDPIFTETRALNMHHVVSVEHTVCKSKRLDREIDELSGLKEIEL